MPILTSGQSRFIGGSRKWYTAGGAPLPIAAYQPKGAASLAASYINLANPGTYDAADGVAPTFDSATGWIFPSSKNRYLLTGIVPPNTQAWSMLVRFAGVTLDPSRNTLAGAYSAPDNAFFIDVSANVGTETRLASGAISAVATGYASGVLGFAGNQAYVNGVAVGSAIGAPSGTNTLQLYIGALNVADSPANLLYGNIPAIAIYNAVLTAGQVAAVSAAMAAL